MIKWHREVLANGLRVVTVEMPHLHSAEVAVYLKVGGRDDPEGKAGLSHFLEHMLFRGTSDYPSGLALETAFEAIGGAVNAATDAETTCIYSRIHPERVTEAVHLFASMLLRPLLCDIETEKRIVAEEALDDMNEQGDVVDVDIVAARYLWPEHPLGMPTIGTLQSISSFTAEDLRSHLTRYYLPNNTVLVVVGRIDPAEVLRAATEEFRAWEPAPLSQPLQFVPGHESHRLVFVPDADSQIDLQLAFHGFSLHDPGLTVLRLIRRILSGGGSSRLHLKLREQLGIVYSVDAAISAFRETGSFTLDFSTAPENITEAVQVTLEEVQRLVTEPVVAEELLRVRRCYLYELEFSADSCYDMQVRYGWGEIVGLLRSPEEERTEVMAVGSEEIRAVARKLFSPLNLVLVAVGPMPTALQEKIGASVAAYERWYYMERVGKG